MRKLVLTFILALNSLSSFGAPKGQISRWQELMNLVTQEMKILESARNKGSDLNYRMLELQSEKLKLIHEKNNRDFLEKSKVSNVTKDKESFFQDTRSYYNETKSFGLKLLKASPHSNRRAEFLFAMALNSRDYGKDSITEGYLLETISLVKDPHHSLRHHAETALADFYYNEKKYQDAVHYYERVIKKTEDEWLTKHYFNLSWCYLKVREFDKAIMAIRESYSLSKDRVYVSVREQVLDNIGSFYVYAGRPMEGLDFYLKNEKDPIPYLLPLAKKTSEKGHQSETASILEASQKIVNKNEWSQYQEELFHSYLDFYRHYSRFENFEETSRLLVAYYLKAEAQKELKLKVSLKEEAIEKIRSLSGFLQVKLAKNMKENGGTYKEEELKLVLSFLTHLIKIDSQKTAEYYYFRGETFYSVRRFMEAAPAYVEAVKASKIAKNEDLTRKSLNSLLSLTGMEVLEKDINKNYLVFAYSEHIAIWPRDEKSEVIYTKLFEIYRESGSDQKASDVLRSFNKSYPEHLKDQQVLMTKVLDLFIDSKDTKKLAAWIHELKKGFLAFSKQTIEMTEITLGNMLFLEYQDLAKKGDKLAAAKGFESIYLNKLYTDKVKSQSAFFASLTYLELSETEKSFSWLKLAVAIMTDEERASKRDEQLKMTERTYKLQDFVTSFKMSQYFLEKFCTAQDDIQNRYFEIAVMTALVEENSAGAENIIRANSACLKKAEIREIALSQLYHFYEKRNDFRGLRLHVHRYPTEKTFTQYRFTLQKWFWETSSLNLKGLIQQELKHLNHPESIAWLKEINEFKQAQLLFEDFKTFALWDRPVFEADAFNKSLESFLLRVQLYNKNYNHLTSSSQTDLAILSSRMFSEVYQMIGLKISSIHPQGMDQLTYKDFQLAMKQIGRQFLTQSKQYERQIEKATKEKETLTWGFRAIASLEQIENPVFSFFTGLTMDKSRGE